MWIIKKCKRQNSAKKFTTGKDIYVFFYFLKTISNFSAGRSPVGHHVLVEQRKHFLQVLCVILHNLFHAACLTKPRCSYRARITRCVWYVDLLSSLLYSVFDAWMRRYHNIDANSFGRFATNVVVWLGTFTFTSLFCLEAMKYKETILWTNFIKFVQNTSTKGLNSGKPNQKRRKGAMCEISCKLHSTYTVKENLVTCTK